MTTYLKKAFDAASKLSEAEQEVLAARLLSEIESDDDFDRAIEKSGDKLVKLAREAISEHRSGQTQKLDPERL